MTNAKQVATTIQQQLGGRMFSMMTGAKNWSYGEEGANVVLAFRIGSGAKCKGKAVNFVRVVYRPGHDLYDMEFGFVRAGKVTIRNHLDCLYADQLQPVFTKNTGFHTSL